MLNTYTPQPTNTLQLKKPTVRLTNDTVAAWMSSMRHRLSWTYSTTSGYTRKIRNFKYFKPLCEWNRRATSMWYGFKYDKYKLNKFFTAIKNCSKVATHLTIKENQHFYCNSLALNALALSDLPRDEVRVRFNRRRLVHKLQADVPITEVHIPISQRLLVKILNRKGNIKPLTPPTILNKTEVMPRAKRRIKWKILNFNYNKLHLRLLAGNPTTAPFNTISYPKGREASGVFNGLTDFRFLYSKRLFRSTNYKIKLQRSANLNLFTYRTNNWMIIV